MLRTNSHVTAGLSLNADVNLLVLTQVTERIADTNTGGKRWVFQKQKKFCQLQPHNEKCTAMKALLKGILPRGKENTVIISFCVLPEWIQRLQAP